MSIRGAWRAGAALLAMLLLAAGWEVATPREMVSFSQGEGELTVTFDSPSLLTGVAVLPRVPEQLEPREWLSHARLAAPGRSVTVRFDGEPTGSEYSILLFAGDEYLELVRQSGSWLKTLFGFTRPGGYTILGRRSVGVAGGRDGVVRSGQPFVVAARPRLAEFDTWAPTPYREVNLAAALLRRMWAMPIRQGPTSLPYGEFLAKPFDTKLEMLRQGEFAVMCQGFRDLFAEAALGVPGLRVRLVNAQNYAPELPDLIPYGHATTEVWVEALGKWVLFDPWMAITVSRDGQLLGAEDLARSSQGARAEPLLAKVPRQYRNGRGEAVRNDFEPGDVDVHRFSCGTLSCSPGYADYFRAVTVIDVTPKDPGPLRQ